MPGEHQVQQLHLGSCGRASARHMPARASRRPAVKVIRAAGTAPVCGLCCSTRESWKAAGWPGLLAGSLLSLQTLQNWPQPLQCSLLIPVVPGQRQGTRPAAAPALLADPNLAPNLQRLISRPADRPEGRTGAQHVLRCAGSPKTGLSSQAAASRCSLCCAGGHRQLDHPLPLCNMLPPPGAHTPQAGSAQSAGG